MANTGYKGWNTLEEYDVNTGEPTGNTKPNVVGDPDYVAPVLDETTCPVPTSPEITESTNIFIVFDSSGSMQTTLPPLEDMRDNPALLKDSLLPYYNNDETLYNNKVRIFSNDQERTWYYLNVWEVFNGTPQGDVIMLVFQDEASRYTHVDNTQYTFDINSNRTQDHEGDISTLRNRIDSNPNTFKQVVFQVNTDPAEENAPQVHLEAFKPFLQAVENGNGLYSGQYGLADKNQVKFKYNITPSSTGQYYTDKVIEALNEFGFNI